MKVHSSKERQMAMSTIIVQATDQSHTLTALRAACDLAYNNQYDIVLLKLVPVNHPSWLGTDDWGYLNLTQQDQESLREYGRYAESCGVKVEVCCLQSISTVDALVGAAENVNAQIVFAHVPHTIIPFLHHWQIWLLRRGLKQRQCQLYTSDDAAVPNRLPAQRPSAVHN
jgi:hypothetical protein